jgi:hypothetical protein
MWRDYRYGWKDGLDWIAVSGKGVNGDGGREGR